MVFGTGMGPDIDKEQTDPVGYSDGIARVTRGGSHNTPVKYLRSANRMAMLPEDKHTMTGFRVVQAEYPQTAPLSQPKDEYVDVSDKMGLGLSMCHGTCLRCSFGLCA